MSDANAYRRLLVEARRTQLADTRENLSRLAGIYDAAAQSVADKIRRLPPESLTPAGGLIDAYYPTLLRELDGTLRNLATDYAGVLDLSLHDLAQNAATREAQTAALVGAPEDGRLAPTLSRTFTLTTGETLSAQFGTVAQGAVEAVARRVFADGLQLSQRLYNLDQSTRRAVSDTVVQAVAEQVSARELASRLETALAAPNVANPRYAAMRVARTEINNAHREAHIASTLDPQTGALKPYIQAIGWRLSLSHPAPDICDIWAGHDSGFGPGNYSPGDVPTDHPHGLCFTVSVLVAYPEVAAPGKLADLENVPPSQVAYYAAQGDPIAAAHT